MSSNNKRRYAEFCDHAYVPIYSKPWWMDAICGKDGWDVWLCERGGDVVAAMPYYLEEREYGLCITKAPLTQTNGILFSHAEGSKPIARLKNEERIIDEAFAHIESLGLAVYEQQFPRTFENWLPFYWHGCTAMPRYSYVVKDTSDIDAMWAAMDSNARQKVRKGAKSAKLDTAIKVGEFYREHEKVFAKQGLTCPFEADLFCRLVGACDERGCCQLMCMRTAEGRVASVLFLVWDERSMYSILGGSIPDLMHLETYHTLIWEGMKFAHEKGLEYDFEGSVIKRISKSFREFGGTPELYFRIRKVFAPDVIRMEAEEQIARLKLQSGNCAGGGHECLIAGRFAATIVRCACPCERRAA